ncbi:MAG TPA: FKBP-type peptidyl-prolyl cis-trans isomerase [Solirubrobacterales bacterium]|nr:FKBP-type peptidyl-prolyl cis-trans isomerase [Solirubrobacterales bacterium]
MGGRLLTIVLCFALLAGGCGGSSSSGATSPQGPDSTAAAEGTSGAKAEPASDQGKAGADVTQPPLWLSGPQPPIRHQKELRLEPSGLAGSEPKPFIPKVHRSDRIVMKDLLDGIGTYAFTGARVTVQYVAYDYATGKKFGSSWDNGRPVTFTLGAGEVIPAWEEALDGMEIGDRRVVVAPPQLAKGSYPPNIPPRKTVGFILELLPDSSEAKAEPAYVAKPAKGEAALPKVPLATGPPPRKLVVKDLTPGAGPRARAGDEIVFRYVELDYKTGRQFDSSSRGRPFSFTLGSHSLFRAWEEGLNGMRVGGRRELIAPPGWVFEPWVSNVPPKTTLVFVVELLAIK